MGRHNFEIIGSLNECTESLVPSVRHFLHVASVNHVVAGIDVVDHSLHEHTVDTPLGSTKYPLHE